MSKVSSTKNDRVRHMYVNRKININGISSVNPIEKIKPVNNNLSSTSENFLLLSGNFYDKYKELHENLKGFYHNQQQLEESLEDFKNTNSNPREEDLLEALKTLIERFNTAFGSLKVFEKTIGKNHSKKIENLLLKYRQALLKIGISFCSHFKLSLNAPIFYQAMAKDRNYIDFLFDHQKGLIKELFLLFKNIKTDFQWLSPVYLPKKHLSAPGIIINKRS